MTRLFPFLCLVFLTSNCGGQVRPHRHAGPFARSNWNPLVTQKSSPENGTSSGSNSENKPERKENPAASSSDIRTEMISYARDLLANDDSSGDFGAALLEDILSKKIPKMRWRATMGLESLVDLAKTKGAYRTQPSYEKGDIILLHNLVDANGNGELDDWYSGGGIVTDVHRRGFEAVVRTGHKTRLVKGWPNGPASDYLDGNKINSFMRVPHRSDPPGTEYLAGQLYAGYIDIEKLDAAFR